MTVLITGASGFVGLALVEALLAGGNGVVALDAAPMPAIAQAHFASLPGALRMVVADARDEAAMARAMEGAECMVIMAAVTAGVEREAAAPEAVIEVNVKSVATAVRLAVGARLQRVLHLSSVAVYGADAQTKGPLSEDMACRPVTLYGVTKAAGEATALRLAALGGLDLVAARLGSCFSPWEHATGLRDTLSPQLEILRASHRGEPVVLESDAARDWLYVRDAAAGLTALLRAPALRHRVYNVGSGMVWPLSAWCDAVSPGRPWRTGPSPHIKTWGARPPASIARLLTDTPFRPQFNAAEAAADWRSFLGRIGSDSFAPRAAG